MRKNSRSGANPRRRVAVVGATGIAGQQFLAVLANHPWFVVTRLGASQRSAGKRYIDALRDPSSGRMCWWADGEPPKQFHDMRVEQAQALSVEGVDMLFSAVEADVARQLEPLYASRIPVISTAAAFRYEEDVPLLLPGVSMDHIRLIRHQQKRRGWAGFVLPQPNCTVTGLAITLKPLHQRFGLKRVSVVSMQGISGAGRSPGVAALDAIDNIVPFIPGEEEKLRAEARKLLGQASATGIVPASVEVSATCTRACVLEGHTEAVSVELANKAGPAEVLKAFRSAGRGLLRLKLPSMPEQLIRVHEDPFRPQPRLDRDAGGGMTTSVGRLRKEPLFRHGLKYLLVSHNTKMGAAKGAVLVAEYLVAKGLV